MKVFPPLSECTPMQKDPDSSALNTPARTTESTSVVDVLDNELLQSFLLSNDNLSPQISKKYAFDLGGRRTDSKWPPPSIPSTLRHVRQSRGWDCGLACVEMVARFCAPLEAQNSGNDFMCLWQEAGTTSLWTIHLSTLLQSRGVPHFYTTTCAGINQDLKSMLFYRGHIDNDHDRVMALFDKARKAGTTIVERSFSVEAWKHAIMTRRIVIILLVDNRALRCVECGCMKRNWFSCTFTGHYILVFAWDTRREAFAYHDPASVCKVCWMRPIDFDKARYAKGTDEDVLVCAY